MESQKEKRQQELLPFEQSRKDLLREHDKMQKDVTEATDIARYNAAVRKEREQVG